MNYLDPSEYEAHGLEATTPLAWIAAASALIDAHCRRPTLDVAQYHERARLDGGRNTVRLSYLPLATVAPAPTPFVAVRARYGVPRRGEGLADAAHEIAQAFSLPGSWTTLDAATIEFSADTGEITLPANALGLTFNELDVTYNAGCSDVPAAGEGGLRADRPQRPGDARAQRPCRHAGPHAPGVFLRHAAGPDRPQVAGALGRTKTLDRRQSSGFSRQVNAADAGS